VPELGVGAADVTGIAEYEETHGLRMKEKG
jgi:hypothetical protein